MSHRVIKRYSNRKLYDTKESVYVTLPEVLHLKRAGENVIVIDNASKRDITNQILFDAVTYEKRESVTKEEVDFFIRFFNQKEIPNGF